MDPNRVIFFAQFFVIQKNASSDSILSDVYIEDNNVHIELEIPDLQQDSLIIEISNNSLIISGFKKKQENNNVTYIRAERIFGNFSKYIHLPCYIKKISTVNYKNGVLEIILERF